MNTRAGVKVGRSEVHKCSGYRFEISKFEVLWPSNLFPLAGSSFTEITGYSFCKEESVNRGFFFGSFIAFNA